MQRIELRTGQRTQMLDITAAVADAVARSGVEAGICLVYVPHTTAAVTINENADPSVRRDILRAVDALVPFADPKYEHAEGNSAAHIKTMLVGSSQSVPVRAAQLVLGTWQGIHFCEFDGPRQREIWVQVLAA